MGEKHIVLKCFIAFIFAWSYVVLFYSDVLGLINVKYHILLLK